MSQATGRITRRAGIAAALVALMALGAWLRLRHLGDLGFVLDEGNQVHAVAGILRDGVPRVPSGQLYTRGLSFLYLEAASARWLGLNEFSLRLPAVVLGLLVVPAVYWLGRTLVDWRVGLAAAAVMALSGWEIELSRYARFYTGFQFFYVLSLVSFFRGFVQGARPFRWAFAPLVLATLSMHELGVLLATCCLIPLCFSGQPWSPVPPSGGTGRNPERPPLLRVAKQRAGEVEGSRGRWRWVVGAVGVGALRVVSQRLVNPLEALGGTIEGAQAASAAGGGLLAHFKVAITSQVAMPPILLLKLFGAHPAAGGLFLLVPALTTLVLLVRGAKQRQSWQHLVFAKMVGAAFLHQFALAATLWAGWAVGYARTWRALISPSLRWVYAAVAVCALVWVPVVSRDPVFGPRLIRTLFGFPHLWRYWLVWLVRGWPVLTVVLVAGTVWLARRAIQDKHAAAPRFVLGAIFLPALLASALDTPFYEARYVFHLYPLMILVAVWVVLEFGGRWVQRVPKGAGRAVAASLVALAALAASNDANPAAAWAIGERSYVSAQDPIRGPTNWVPYAGFHQDHKNPSLYVKNRLHPKDVVVAVGPPHAIAVYQFYIGRVDYGVDEVPRGYQPVLRDGRILEHVAGSQILTSPSALRRVLNGAAERRVWLLCDQPVFETEDDIYSPEMKRYLKSLTRHPVFVGLDRKTFVAQVP